jgi:hypothetical protein
MNLDSMSFLTCMADGNETYNPRIPLNKAWDD